MHSPSHQRLGSGPRKSRPASRPMADSEKPAGSGAAHSSRLAAAGAFPLPVPCLPPVARPTRRAGRRLPRRHAASPAPAHLGRCVPPHLQAQSPQSQTANLQTTAMPTSSAPTTPTSRSRPRCGRRSTRKPGQRSIPTSRAPSRLVKEACHRDTGAADHAQRSTWTATTEEVVAAACLKAGYNHFIGH